MDNHKIPEKVLRQALRQSIQAAPQNVQPSTIPSEIASEDSAISTASGSSGSSSRAESPSLVASRIRSPVRVFRAQESVTNFLVSTDPNFQAMHDALIIHLTLILLFTFVRDTYRAEGLFLGTSFFQAGFGSFNDAKKFLLYEPIILAYGFSLHPVFKLWKYLRQVMSKIPKIVDTTFVTLYLMYIIGGFMATIHVLVVNESLPRVTTLILGVEQFRIAMKSYSFIRENAYKVVYPWHKDDTSGPAVWYKGQMSPTVGSFKQYCYFLFAPTLLYRDHYPRTAGIKWHAVVMYGLQIFVALGVAVFIACNILYPSSLREQDVVQCFMLSLVVGLVSLVLCNLVILHSYTNLTAELMCFADRKFYDAWWTCTSFSSFYRKWNLLVHDWIHSYIYLDMRKILSKRLAVFSTILVSSAVHEYLLALGMGFMLPVVTSLFAGIGVFFYILKPLSTQRISNLFILLCLSLGMAIIISVLVLETASRQYCYSPGMSWFKPQILHCYSRYNQ